MALIGTYYTIEPKDWLFSTHGDVVEANLLAHKDDDHTPFLQVL